MWALNLMVRDNPQYLTLHYKTRENAEKMLVGIADARNAAAIARTVVLRDDFTRRLDIVINDILATVLMDLDAAAESNIEGQLALGRMNASVIMRMDQDPKLKMLKALGQVPLGQRHQ